MSKRLRCHPLVVDDLKQATAWYDGISIDLGNRFRERVNECLDKITEQPSFVGIPFEDFCVALVQRFPYLVLFRESSGAVYVLGIFHSASDPEKWQKRAIDS